MSTTKTTPELARQFIEQHGYRQVYCAFNSLWPIHLWQSPDGQTFAVTYGCQYALDMDYAAAALDLGASIMHWLTCEGLMDPLDDDEEGETE